MKYLVDANVLSEATKPSPDPKVIAWISANEGDCVVDPVILGELAIGILVLPIGRKRAKLVEWFDTVVARVECLAWDTAISRRWAQLVADLKKSGRTLPVLDSMIAATALAHRLTIATHNIRDFKKADVPVLDPFD
jgi:predicted nucleic acid-binding protein